MSERGKQSLRLESLDVARGLLARLWNCEYWARAPYCQELQAWAIDVTELEVGQIRREAQELEKKVIQLDGLCEQGIQARDLFEETFQEHLLKLDMIRAVSAARLR